MPPTEGLTDKQRRFCEEYLVDLNATQAAIRAGYSEDSAGHIGWENQRKPEIQAEIARLLAEYSQNAVAMRSETVSVVSSILREGKDQDRLKAAEVLSKLHGWNEPEKHDHLIDAKAQVWATPPPQEKEQA